MKVHGATGQATPSLKLAAPDRTTIVTDYIDQFTDEQIRELHDNASETFREVYMTIAGLPKAEWPVPRLKYLSDLRKTIVRYENELARRRISADAPVPRPEPLAQETSQLAKASRAARVFISYSHADEVYKSTLEKHLALLNRIGVIETWSDRALTPGQAWDAEIQSRLEQADIILLLVSVNFLASDYSYVRETALALDRARSGSAAVVPVILSPVDWKLAPFSSLQALPRNAQPITTWANQDEAWAQVAEGVRRLVQCKGLGL